MSAQQAFVVRVHRPVFEGPVGSMTLLYAVLTDTPLNALRAVERRENDDVEMSYAGVALRSEHVAALGLSKGVPVVL